MKKLHAFHRVTLSVAGILLALVLAVSVLKAQCPTDVSPPVSSYPWIHASSLVYFTTPGGCSGQVDYCYRDLANWPVFGERTYQSVVISFFLEPGCTDDPTAIMEAAAEAVEHDVETYHLTSLPPCNGEVGVVHGQSLRPACWKLTAIDPPPSNRRYFQQCNAGQGVYCVLSGDVCDNGSRYYRFNLVNSLIGTPTCDDAPTDISLWYLNACFHVQCGSNP